MDYESGPFYNRNTAPPPEGCSIGKYHIDSLISSTNYLYVFIGKDTESNEKKVIKFVKFIRNNVEKINREIEIMKIANHPNILRLEDDFRYNEYACIVSKFAPNQDLQQYIAKNYPNGLPESTAKNIFKQMLEAVNYLHKLNICHRDIKLNNFLVFDSDTSQPQVVLSDFGFSIQFTEEEKGEDLCGTPEYMAPEIYNYDLYDINVDIWSLGISLYKLLTAKSPFLLPTTTLKELRNKILRGHLNLDILKKLKISDEAIDLILKMCTKNPKKRIKAGDALNHCWFNSIKSKINDDRISKVIQKGEKVICDSLI